MQECFIYNVELEYLKLIFNYPDLLDVTIAKKEYFHKDFRDLFEILTEEHKKSKVFIIENLFKYNKFNVRVFSQINDKTMYNASRYVTLKEFEKTLIDRYKIEQTEVLVKNYKGDYNKLFNALQKINELNYNESEYIKASRMYEIMSSSNQKINLGYHNLDYALNLNKNDLLIIGGGTGTGKTAFALNLLVNLSGKYQIIYFNMEMGERILYRRLSSILTRITMSELRNINQLNSEKKELLKQAMLELEERKIIMVNKAVSTNEIYKTIQNIKTDKHIIAIIDHIGLIRGKGNNLYEKITTIAKDLRAISINTDCTIIGLCQLSRGSQRSEDAPVLQDLRDSGEIEQSARKAILLHNVSEDKEQRVQEMKIIIAKNDDGDKLVKSFRFDRYTQTFEEDR